VAVGFYELTGLLEPLDPDASGVCETYQSEAGVIAKVDTPPHHIVANEYVAAELAKLIRLPLPPSFCAIIKRTDEKAFCSLNATLEGARLPAVNPRAAVADEPDLCTGVLLFDIWIANPDRHAGNLSYQRARRPHRLTIFDHSHALFYYGDFVSRYHENLGIVDEWGRRHCLLDALTSADYFDKWITRIRKVPNECINEILTDAEDLGLPRLARYAGIDFIRNRRNKLDALIRAHQSEFRGIAEWGLLWPT